MIQSPQLCTVIWAGCIVVAVGSAVAVLGWLVRYEIEVGSLCLRSLLYSETGWREKSWETVREVERRNIGSC